MLILRYLLRETLKSQLAIFLILMAIFITLRFVQVLGEASDGDIPASLVLGFLALYTPILASLVLPISAFLGIMMAHGRMYVDSEMSVMRACGISEWYVARVMLMLSLFITIITAIVTLYLAPLSAEQEFNLKQKARAEAGLSSIIPGRFQQTGNKQAVIFVHGVDSNNKLEKIFLSQQSKEEDQQKVRVVYAEKGKVIGNPDGTKNLVLEDGVQYEGTQNNNKYRIVEFDEYTVQISEPEVVQKRARISVLPTKDLLSNGAIEAKAELQWRIAVPLSIPFLMLIAVPLSTVNPRQGRFGKMFPAILLYLGYFLLLMASRKAMEDEKIPSYIGLWWVHIVMLFIGSTLIVRDRQIGAYVRAKVLRKRHA